MIVLEDIIAEIKELCPFCFLVKLKCILRFNHEDPSRDFGCVAVSQLHCVLQVEAKAQP